jgi:hypothetical protein
MDQKQQKLVQFYASLSLDELYGLVGEIAEGTPKQIDSLEYPSRLSDFKKAGEEAIDRMMVQLKERICSSYDHLKTLINANEEALRVIEWAGTIADVIVVHNLGGGYPPFLIAVTLGKMCGWRLDKLC